MKKEKYLANIEKTLVDFFAKKSKSLADRNVIPFSEDLVRKGHIRKVAFDFYKVDNDPYHNLWVTQEIDGRPHLVRADAPASEIKESGNWSAASDNEKRNITLSYKNIPITRFSSDDYGFDGEDIITFKSALLDRLDSDGEFIKDLLSEQPSNKREALAAAFPELQEIIKG